MFVCFGLCVFCSRKRDTFYIHTLSSHRHTDRRGKEKMREGGGHRSSRQKLNLRGVVCVSKGD